jgi:hypothetical protein
METVTVNNMYDPVRAMIDSCIREVASEPLEVRIGRMNALFKNATKDGPYSDAFARLRMFSELELLTPEELKRFNELREQLNQR